LGSDRELDALAGLELSLDEGANGVDREEHHDGEDETEEEVEGGVGQLLTDGLDADLGEGRKIEGSVIAEVADTTGLGPFLRRVDDSVLKARI
jgi:hypothetical protein